MASILYAWEFGANLGHAGAFMPLARMLRERGHEVHWAVAQPASVGEFLASEGFNWVAAPGVTETTRSGPPLSYADILLRFGYADAKALFGLVGAWRELMRLTGATLVLADHAPTAVLAARSLGNLPTMLFSNGFTVPPRCNPLPNMRHWQALPLSQLQALDDTACNSINAMLERFQSPPLSCTADIFDVAEETMLTFPELDHYPDRGPARYWGSLPSAGGGRSAQWPGTPVNRCFAYLRPESPHHELALNALQALGASALIYAPGLPSATVQRYSSPQMRFLEHPADMAQMTREADVAITYASIATTTAFLLAGKPLLMLPGHLEQFLVARRIVDLGAGALVNPEQAPGDLRSILAALFNDPAYRENARAFARKYAAFDQSQVIRNLVRRVEELLNPNQTPTRIGELK